MRLNFHKETPSASAAFSPYRSVIVLLPHAKALCDDDSYDIDSDRIKSTANPTTAAGRGIYDFFS